MKQEIIDLRSQVNTLENTIQRLENANLNIRAEYSAFKKKIKILFLDLKQAFCSAEKGLKNVADVLNNIQEQMGKDDEH